MAYGSQSQNILQQLQDMGFGTYGTQEGGEYEGMAPFSWMDIANITPQQISSNLTKYFDLGEGIAKPHLFGGISRDLLNLGLGKTYSGEVEQRSQPLLASLVHDLTGREASRAAGGFSGSGGLTRYKEGVKDVYGGGMTDILAQTGARQATGMSKVQDVIDQWKETVLSLT